MPRPTDGPWRQTRAARSTSPFLSGKRTIFRPGGYRSEGPISSENNAENNDGVLQFQGEARTLDGRQHVPVLLI